MSEKKNKPKKSKEPTTKKEVATRTSEDKRLLWLGGQKLFTTPANAREQKERDMIITASRVLDVSPFGVNILGGLPYINQLGLKQKADRYAKQDNAILEFKYEWVKIAQDDTEKAICKCKILKNWGNKKKYLTDWVLGECSPATTGMSTLKGYQNHMAQTRSRNRAIKEAFGIMLHEEMLTNIQKLHEEAKELKQKPPRISDSNPLATSVEEARGATNSFSPVKKEKQTSTETNDLMAGESEKAKIASIAKRLNIDTSDLKKMSEGIFDRIGLVIDFDNLTKVQAKKVLFLLLETQQA